MKLIKCLAVIAIFFATACTNDKYSKQIEEVDKLIELTEALKEKTDTVNFVHINENFQKYMEHVGIIKKYANSEDSVLHKQILAYAQLRRPMRNLVRDEGKYKKELEYTLSQLKSLKSNIKNNKLDSLQIVEYIETEKRATLRFVSDYSIIIDEAVLHSNMFDTIYPKMDKVLQALVK